MTSLPLLHSFPKKQAKTDLLITMDDFTSKYKTGITFGVFDLFHVGHLNLLERCKAMCEHFVVAICDDDYVRNVKHKEPVIPQNDRVRIVNALKCVDQVILVNAEETSNKLLVFQRLPFNVLFSGDDWKGSERYIQTEKEFAQYGISIEYLPYTKGISTTQLKASMGKN